MATTISDLYQNASTKGCWKNSEYVCRIYKQPDYLINKLFEEIFGSNLFKKKRIWHRNSKL